jgi:hypothetical protein
MGFNTANDFVRFALETQARELGCFFLGIVSAILLIRIYEDQE